MTFYFQGLKSDGTFTNFTKFWYSSFLNFPQARVFFPSTVIKVIISKLRFLPPNCAYDWEFDSSSLPPLDVVFADFMISTAVFVENLPSPCSASKISKVFPVITALYQKGESFSAKAHVPWNFISVDNEANIEN